MRSIAWPAVLALLAAACSPAGSIPRSASAGSFRTAGVTGHPDPTVRPARLLPESIDDSATSYGSEPDGALRVMTAGLRLVTSPKGAIAAADDRFPQAPTSTVALPERLGGGFLFIVGKSVWRAEQWLDTAKPIFSSVVPINAIVPGLDRVYVRAPNAAFAIDGRTGKALDLGPWPASPRLSSYGAADGFRAAAIADLRGVIATFDAGATWRTLDVAMQPERIVVTNDSIAIGGLEPGDVEAWYELLPDGSLARTGTAPRDANRKLVSLRDGRSAGRSAPRAPTPASAPKPEPPRSEPGVVESGQERATKIFGKRPLATAIEDGWPLTDGTAIIARDGSLGRVQLADGALVDVVTDAFPLKSARCHPVSLSTAKAPGAFGFVCGEPRGATIVYAYDAQRGRLVEMKHFDRPRVVASSGNGSLVVRGPCAEDGEPPAQRRPDPAKLEPVKDNAEDDTADGRPAATAKPLRSIVTNTTSTANVARPVQNEAHPYCVLGPDGGWREIIVRGDADSERVVVLRDGRTAVISPPQGFDSPARLTILDKSRAMTAPVVFPRVSSDVARVLRLGMWLEGFEERRPGVLGGWIEAGGVMLGIEIALDGKATPGQFVRDAGSPFVAGRYGLGWTASRRGYETTDGGMTWTSIDLPAPLLGTDKVERRACGPIGCLANGWLRVGWGGPKQAVTPSAPAPAAISTVSLSVPHVELACEPAAGLPPAPRVTKPTSPTPTPRPSALSISGGPPVLGTVNGVREFQPFLTHTAPVLHESERGLSIDIGELADQLPRVGTLGRVYGWGPSTGDWDTLGHWQVTWLSPFAGWPDTRASLPSLPPTLLVDMTRASSSPWRPTRSSFLFATGDDASHALLVGRDGVRADGPLFELEADRAPIEVRRADGEPFGEIEGMVRAAGRWFIATAGARVPSPTTIVWQIEGGIAHELVRVPRVTDSNASRARLARRSDGRAIGLVVDGEQTAERSTNVRWVLPIQLESGALGTPESLGYVDLAGRTLDACSVDDAAGWELDSAWPSSVRLRLAQGSGWLSQVLARLRLTSTRACIETLTGTYDGQSPDRRTELVRAGAGRAAGAPRPGELQVTATSMQTRFPLRCSVAK